MNVDVESLSFFRLSFRSCSDRYFLSSSLCVRLCTISTILLSFNQEGHGVRSSEGMRNKIVTTKFWS